VIFHFFFAMTVFAVLLKLWLTRDRGISARRIVRVSLLYLLCIQWGFGAAYISVPHIIFPDQIAEFIGWAPGSPFQRELGFASLGTSILGILCIWLRGWFWLGPIVSRSIFLLGAGYIHIEDILVKGNLSPGNAGPVLFYDIVIPFLAVGLFIAYARHEELGSDTPTQTDG
jgi:hypothetical protein